MEEPEREVETIRGQFVGVPCDDCSKQEVVCSHWGQLVPPGMRLNLCDACMENRVIYFNATGAALPLQIFSYIDLQKPIYPRIKCIGQVRVRTGARFRFDIGDATGLYLVAKSKGIRNGAEAEIEVDSLPESWAPRVGGKISAEFLMEIMRRGEGSTIPEMLKMALFNALATVYVQSVAPNELSYKIVALDYTCEYTEKFLGEHASGMAAYFEIGQPAQALPVSNLPPVPTPPNGEFDQVEF
jgi:hypothetical protein